MTPHMQEIQAVFSLVFSGVQSSNFVLDVEISLPAKGVTAIFGPSGSGKTTLLRCMAGLQESSAGYFSVGEEIWQDADTFKPVHKRPQGFVFQEASLFDHLSVDGNLQYARKRIAANRNSNASDVREQSFDFDKLLSLLGIEHLLQKYPAQLSGGEKQRVAIARALLRRPDILFMDEPLAALDYQRKQEILPYLEALTEALSIPIIYVSHAIEEVARLADYLVVMESGKVLTQGPLQKVLSRVDLPIHLDNDLGAVLDACVVERDPQWHLMKVAFDGGFLWLKDTGHSLNHKLRVRVLAKDVSLAVQRQHSSILNHLEAKVTSIVDDRDPAMALVSLSIGETGLIARLTKRSVAYLALKPGLAVWAQIKSVAILP